MLSVLKVCCSRDFLVCCQKKSPLPSGATGERGMEVVVTYFIGMRENRAARSFIMVFNFKNPWMTSPRVFRSARGCASVLERLTARCMIILYTPTSNKSIHNLVFIYFAGCRVNRNVRSFIYYTLHVIRHDMHIR